MELCPSQGLVQGRDTTVCRHKYLLLKTCLDRQRERGREKEGQRKNEKGVGRGQRKECEMQVFVFVCVCVWVGVCVFTSVHPAVTHPTLNTTLLDLAVQTHYSRALQACDDLNYVVNDYTVPWGTNYRTWIVYGSAVNHNRW